MHDCRGGKEGRSKIKNQKALEEADDADGMNCHSLTIQLKELLSVEYCMTDNEIQNIILK